MKDLEIEIQVQVEKIDNLIKFLNEKGKSSGQRHQIDQYFIPSHRDFTAVRPISEWLRLRDNNGKFSIDYKNWHRDDRGKTNDCDEYISKFENIDSFRKILKVLNFKEICTVEKNRKIYTYKEYEIALDEVKGLGDFVEIEFKGNSNKSPAEITLEMVRFLKDIKVGRITRNYVGYAFMILAPAEKYDIEEL